MVNSRTHNAGFKSGIHKHVLAMYHSDFVSGVVIRFSLLRLYKIYLKHDFLKKDFRAI